VQSYFLPKNIGLLKILHNFIVILHKVTLTNFY